MSPSDAPSQNGNQEGDSVTRPNIGRERLARIVDASPTTPGVYLMKNSDGRVIYVGKAKNLKNRLRSYLRVDAQISIRISLLVDQIADIELMHTGSEVEALILENFQIKKLKPKYNVLLKDDKTYPFLKLDWGHDYPRAYVTRKRTSDQAEYIGPFPNSKSLWDIVELSSKLFQMRDCRDHEFANRSRPCLTHQIGHCTAPCVGLTSKTDYAKQVKAFRAFVKGDHQGVQRDWTRAMKQASQDMKYELAASFRDRLQTLEQFLNQQEQRVHVVEDRIDRDVWAFWPELSNVSESDSSAEASRSSKPADQTLSSSTQDPFQIMVVLQFRDGQWSGQIQRVIDLSEKIPDASASASALFQFYMKHPTPQNIVVPPELIPRDSTVADALAAMYDQNNVPPSPTIVYADLGKIESRLWALARDNAHKLYDEHIKDMEKKSEGLEELRQFLNLDHLPQRMECIDISNFQGSANVASLVVFENGKPANASYRHYKIKSFEGQDDYSSIREVVRRRFESTEKAKPDLLIIDGGKGQLAAAFEMLQAMEISIPVIGLAKARTESDFQSEHVTSSEERVFFPERKNHKALKVGTAPFRLLTQIRDEAHRFAITFHRKQRDRLE